MFERFSRRDLEIELLNTVLAEDFRVDFDSQQSPHARPALRPDCLMSQALGDTSHTKALQDQNFFFSTKSVYWDNSRGN